MGVRPHLVQWKAWMVGCSARGKHETYNALSPTGVHCWAIRRVKACPNSRWHEACVGVMTGKPEANVSEGDPRYLWKKACGNSVYLDNAQKEIRVGSGEQNDVKVAVDLRNSVFGRRS